MLSELGPLFGAAEKAARSLGISVAVAAVDFHGNTVLMLKMRGAPPFADHMATRKAYTAIAMDVDTDQLTSQIQPGAPLFGLIEASGGRLLPFGGGAVVDIGGGERLGFGVSGGTTDQDVAVLMDLRSAAPRRQVTGREVEEGVAAP